MSSSQNRNADNTSHNEYVAGIVKVTRVLKVPTQTEVTYPFRVTTTYTFNQVTNGAEGVWLL